jgi:hypothetical protein
MIDVSEALESVRDRAPLPEGTLAAFVVGSYARGWANSGSDVDVVVVAKSQPQNDVSVLPVPLDPPAVAVAAWYLDACRWEVKYWLPAQVDQMLGKVAWEAFESNPAATQSLIELEELFLERLLTAVPLIGADWIEQMRERLVASAFRTLLLSRSMAEADAAIVDALGQAQADDLTSAALSARKAYGHAVDAALESQGHYGSLAVKWRARRVAEAALPSLPFEQYWMVETMEALDRDDPRGWVLDTVQRARALMMGVEL